VRELAGAQSACAVNTARRQPHTTSEGAEKAGGAALPLAVVGGLLIAGLISLPILLARGRGATLPLVPFLAVGALLACLAPARAAIGL
jgi:prepilin signal peptidase PulO-like enzyme (type II secretory pathway)